MWFKSKIEHPDPEIRRKHVEQLEADDAALIEVARDDPHPDVRSAAVARIVDLPVLQELVSADGDQRVREIASARLHEVIAGNGDSSPALESRLAFLDSSADDRLMRFVARSAQEPALRKVAINRLLAQTDKASIQDLLCDIAADDPVQEIRQAAAQPIQDKDRLQKLLERSRGRDKSVHRLARDRLEQIQVHWAAREGLEECCGDAEQLAVEHHFSADGKAEAARLARVTGQWDLHAAAADQIEQQLTSRYQAARDGIESKLAAIRIRQQSHADIMAALAAHLDGSGAEPVAGLTRRWHELGEAAPAQQREFDKLVRRVTEHDSRRDRDEQRETGMRAILAHMQSALAADTFLKKDIARLEQAWDSAKPPENETLKNELRQNFLASREKLRARLDRQAQELESDIGQVSALLDHYEETLEAGKLSEAVSSHDKVVSAIARLDVPDARRRKLQERLRAGEPRMTELKRWRHWGTDRKREELCDRAEQLSLDDTKIPAVAKAVREFRDQWKALDKSDGPASKKLWTRFDAACEKAYEPCQAYFDQQKAQRQGNMKQRVGICEELEALAGNTDWEAPPWRELSETLRAIERRWHKAGSVDRREKNKIQKRYDNAISSIEAHLADMRQQEIDRREALIARIEALEQDTDSRQQVNIARQAQRDWKPLVQAGRRKEQQLWKRFRAACDGIFERRKEQFAAADQEREQNLAEKLAVHGQIVEMIEASKEHLEKGTGDKDAISQFRKKSKQLSSGWRRIGPVPRDKQTDIDKKFGNSCRELETLCGSLEQQFARRAMAGLRDVAARCEELELSLASGESIDTAAVDDELTELGASIEDDEIDSRIQRIKLAAGGDGKALNEINELLAGNRDTKRKLCLEMEIAANIESPDDCREERMQYRVTQLSESMSGNRRQLEPVELERLWYRTGAVPAAEKEQLEQRFRHALEALSAG